MTTKIPIFLLFIPLITSISNLEDDIISDLFQLDSNVGSTDIRRVSSQEGPLVEEASQLFQQTRSLLGKILNFAAEEEQGEDRIKEKSGAGQGDRLKKIFSVVDTLGELPMKIGTLRGDHICVEEIHRTEQPQQDEDGKVIKLSMESGCQRFADADVCTLKKTSGKITKRVQKCCDGYTTTDIGEGCNEELTTDYLDNLNITNNYLVGKTRIEDENGKEYLINGTSSIFEWNDRQIIEAENGDKFVVSTENGFTGRIRLNCASYKQQYRVPRHSPILKFDGELKPAAKHVLEVIEKDERFSGFLKIMPTSLKSTIMEEEFVTVFAFTNNALQKLPEKTREIMMSGDKNECVGELMRDHITLSGAYCADSLYGMIRTLSGNQHIVSRLKIDNHDIIDTNNYALNGVVHIIDGVLIRDNFLSWIDTVKSYHPDLAQKLETLNLTQPLTIFVPPNSTKIENPLDQVVSGRIIKDFDSVKDFKTDGNSSIFIGSGNMEPSKLFMMHIRMTEKPNTNKNHISCVKFTQPPIYSCKSVIHFVEKPLPHVNQTIEEFLASRSDLSSFYSLWKTANVTLRSRATVLAPTNGAFSPNYLRKLEDRTTLVEQFVKRHVVESIMCASDIQKSPKEVRHTIYKSLGGDTLSPSYTNRHPEIGGAEIEELEHVLSDGVVHVLSSYIEVDNNPRLMRQDAITVGMTPGNQRSVIPFSLFSHLFG